MENLLNRLIDIINNEDDTSTDYQVAFTLLLNFYTLSRMSSDEVAELCRIPTSTFSDFIHHMGYQDYADFISEAPFMDNQYRNKKKPI